MHEVLYVKVKLIAHNALSEWLELFCS